MRAKDWHREETYKSLIQIGVSALKFVLLANGGAAVAILAFIGKVYLPGTPIPNVAPSLVLFLLGIVFGGLAHVTGYATQFTLYNEEDKKKQRVSGRRHQIWLRASVALVVAAIICFAAGSLCGVYALTE